MLKRVPHARCGSQRCSYSVVLLHQKVSTSEGVYFGIAAVMCDGVEMDAFEWDFLAEGKMHIILVNNRNQFTEVNVMRIEKCAVACEHGCGLNKTRSAQSANSDNSFLQSHMLPWFSCPVVSLSAAVRLTDAFINALVGRISGCRPKGRIKACPVLKLSPFAYIETNYNYVCKQLPPCVVIGVPGTVRSKQSISFDIKVKCGLKSMSPFVPLHRDIKRRYSKFAIMQLYKLGKILLAQGLIQLSDKSTRNTNGIDVNDSNISSMNNCKAQTVQPEWGSFHNISSYNPSDLCSGQHNKVNSALQLLLKNPQNNLKVCVDGVHVYGWDKDTNLAQLSVICHSCLFDSNSNNDDIRGDGIHNTVNDSVNASASLDVITDAITAILCNENTLERLQRMQSLDIIDVEGAAAIFRRLETLIGSHDDAVSVLSAALLEPVVGIEYIADCIAFVVYAKGNGDIPHEHIADVDLSNCPSVIMQMFQLSVSDSMTTSELQSRYDAAHVVVQSMTVDDCVLLLKLWMLALVAKDASVIIALRPVDIVADSIPTDVNRVSGVNDVDSTRSATSSSSGCVCVLQSSTHAGIVTCQHITSIVTAAHTNDDNKRHSFAYNLSLIDLGLKSVDKVWLKDEEEDDICALSSACLAYLNGDVCDITR